MATYMVRRFVQSLLFIGLAALFIYTVLVILTPTGPNWRYQRLLKQGQPVSNSYGPPRDAQLLDLAERYKLDRPWPLDFFAWLFDPQDTPELNRGHSDLPPGIDVTIAGLHIKGSGILTGNFGRSIVQRGRPVTDLVGERAGNTFILVGVSLVVSLLLAIPIGVLGAVRHGSWVGHLLTFVLTAGRSIPPFALGAIFVIFLAVAPFQLHSTGHLDWMPYLPPGEISSADQENNIIDRIYHLVLPVATLSAIQIVWLSRYVRSAMLEVLSQDYIRTARAKGVSTVRVIYKHAFRNAVIPLITIFGLALPGVVSGAIIIEQVFNYRGLGQLYFRSLGASLVTAGTAGLAPEDMPPIGFPVDYPLALAITLMLIVVVALSNVLADFMYALADPRINMSERA